MRHDVKRSNHMRHAMRSKNIRHAVKRQIYARESISWIVQSVRQIAPLSVPGQHAMVSFISSKS
jgi:hypothetical protein